MEKMEFFTRKDLELVSEWGNKDYDSSDTQKQIGKRLKHGPIRKTENWAKQTAKKINLESKTTKHWLVHGQKFRPYTWGRVWDPNAFEPEVYFTVGITGHEDPYLHIKLDYQFETPKSLNDDQLRKAKKLLRPNGEAKFEKKILLDNISKFGWEKLISETTAFIDQNKEHYYQVISKLSRKENQFYTRICWNTLGWREPSGSKGKSKNPNTYEGIIGIGNEEWLFSDNFQVDGYQYGHLQASNLYNKPSIFDVDLYTLENTVSGVVPYFVATINNLEVLNKNQQGKLEEKTSFIRGYVKKHTSSDQWEKLISQFPDFLESPMINVRFRMKNVIFIDEENLTPIKFRTNKIHMYQLHEGSLFEELENQIDFIDDEEKLLELSDSGRERGSKKPRTVIRSAGSYQSEQDHIKISELLEKHLETLASDRDLIIAERGLGNKAIDMVWETDDKFIFYEIKTYSNISYCIRQAVGQLLEYAYYRRPEVQKEYKLIICSPHESTQAVEEYMHLLRDRFGLKIYYQQFDVDEGVLRECV